MSSEDFCRFGYATYNPVALIVSPFILNQIIAHVNERLTKGVILTYGLEMSIQFSFTYFLGKFSTVFQGLHQRIHFVRHSSKLIAGAGSNVFRKHTLGYQIQSVSHVVERLH